MTRNRIALLLAAIAILAGFGAWLPRPVRQEVAVRVARRFPAADVSVSGIELGRHELSLGEVRLHGDGGDLELEGVRVEVESWFDQRIGRIVIDHVAGRIDREASLVRRAPDGQDASNTTTAGRLAVAAHVDRLEMFDAEGDLGAFSGDITLEGGLLTVALTDVVAMGPGSEVRAAEVRLTASVAERQLRTVHVERAVITTESDEAVRALRGRWLRPAETESSQASAPTTVVRHHWSERFSSDFRAELRDATLTRGGRMLFEHADVELERTGERAIRTVGHGALVDGGAIGWDGAADVEALTAHGNVRFSRLPLVAALPFLPELPLFEPERTFLDGELEVRPSSSQQIDLVGRVAVRELGLSHPRLAAVPVTGIGLVLTGQATFDREAHRLSLREARLEMGGASLSIAGDLRWDPPAYGADLRLMMASTPCQVAIHALPPAMTGDVSTVSFEGSWGGSIELRVDSAALDATELRVRVADGCRFMAIPTSIDVARFAGPFVHEVVEPDDTIFSMTTGPGTGSWTMLPGISPFLVQAVLTHEDGGFFDHHGFSPRSIRDALVRNLREGRYVLGASTITMQLVKNVFLRREKTLVRKIQEVLLTWWLEHAMTKPQILELYLNVIEFGPDIYGIRAASEHYFGRSPSELSPAESAFIALILPNPPLFHEIYDRGELTPSFRGRVASFLRIMAERGRIDREALEYGLAELPTFRFHRAGDMTTERVVQGRAGALPIEGWSGRVGDEPVLDEPADAPSDEEPAWETYP